jgi:hypothetical protein
VLRLTGDAIDGALTFTGKTRIQRNVCTSELITAANTRRPVAAAGARDALKLATFEF